MIKRKNSKKNLRIEDAGRGRGDSTEGRQRSQTPPTPVTPRRKGERHKQKK